MSSYEQLIAYLIARGELRSQYIIDAFKNTDRADFVPSSFFSDIYGDYPLEIGYGQTISQPTTVAMMMEMLEPKEGDEILDIGSGSGWTTAILANIVGEKGFVTGVERVEELLERGRKNLSKYNFSNATIIKAGEKLGVPGKKFDRILVSASADKFPYELVDQLKDNGKLVIPVQDYIYEVTKMGDNIQVLKHYGFRFVPLIY